MRVMLCADMDWANVGYMYAECLKTQGVDAEMFVRGHTKNKVPSRQGTLVSLEKMVSIMGEYDVVQFMHTGRRILVPYHGMDKGPTRFDKEPYLNDFVAEKIDSIRAKGVKTAVFHGGTFYRLFHKKIHNLNINRFFDITFIQTGDLFELGGHNERWLLPAIDTDMYRPSYKKSGRKLRISHFPSNPKVKNTRTIEKVVDKVSQNLNNFNFTCSTEKVSHLQNLKRMKRSDVYIEHQGFNLRGKTYGEFGVTAFEAAALGNIVITCTKLQSRYEKEYGKFAPYISNSEQELELRIREVAGLTEHEIIRGQKESRQWVCDNHSYAQVGRQLVNIYGSI